MKGSVAERVGITLICFGYPTLSSTYAVIVPGEDADYTTFAALQMLVIELCFGGAAALVLRLRGWRRSDFGFAVTPASTVAGVGLFALLLIVCDAAYLALQATGALEGWAEAPVTTSAIPAVYFLFLAVNSVYEEVFVTGYLIEASRASGTAFAVSLSTIVRLLYHTYQGPAALAWIVPVGLVFGAVYARYRNLWPLIAAHTVMNLYSWAVN